MYISPAENKENQWSTFLGEGHEAKEVFGFSRRHTEP